MNAGMRTFNGVLHRLVEIVMMGNFSKISVHGVFSHRSITILNNNLIKQCTENIPTINRGNVHVLEYSGSKMSKVCSECCGSVYNVVEAAVRSHDEMSNGYDIQADAVQGWLKTKNRVVRSRHKIKSIDNSHGKIKY